MPAIHRTEIEMENTYIQNITIAIACGEYKKENQFCFFFIILVLTQPLIVMCVL